MGRVKNNSVLDIISKTLKPYVEFCLDNGNSIINFLQTALPIVICFNEYTRTGDISLLLGIIALEFGISCLSLLYKIIMRDKNSMPIPTRRFTEKVGNEIRVKRSDFEIMLIYVYELEEYLERNDLK